MDDILFAIWSWTKGYSPFFSPSYILWIANPTTCLLDLNNAMVQHIHLNVFVTTYGMYETLYGGVIFCVGKFRTHLDRKSVV